MSTRVTALILSFNRSSFIAEALNSVASQTEKEWAVVLSDCSDDTAIAREIEAIFNVFKKQNPDHQCDLIKQPQRMRQNIHLATAMKEVATPYVALLDDDDYWLPDHLKRSLDWLDSDSENGLVIENAQVVDESGHDRGVLHGPDAKRPDPDHQSAQMEFFLRTFFGSTSGFVLRVNAFDGWTLPDLPLVDVHIAFATVTNGFRCRCFIEKGYAYREHSGSNYEKGNQVFKERHIWRCRLAREKGFRILRRCPIFILLYLKSLFYLAKARFAPSP